MNVPPTLKVAIIGCGLAGCGIVTILKDSFSNMPSAPAFLVAVDDSDEALGQTMADRKVLLASGGKPDLDLSGYSVAFFVLDPSEAGSLTMAQVLASSGKKAYTFGFLIKPAGGWQEDDRTVYGSFDASALIDEGRVLELRKGKDPEYAMRIVLNFIAHVLTFMSEAIRDGKLSTDALYRATYGKVSGFAATSVSQPESLYNMTMSKIDKDLVKSAILFMTEDTDNMLARRIFLSVASSLPRSMEMIALRVKYVEPFRIVALLAY